MQHINISIYTFEELQKEAKQKALDALRDINVDNSHWYDFVLSDFTAICKTIGITTREKDIYFQGFYSQGNGSAFDATIDLSVFLAAIREQKWKEYAPDEKFCFADNPINNRVLALIKNGLITSTISTSHTNRYYHLNYYSDHNFFPTISYNTPNIDRQLDLLDEWIRDILHQLNRYLYKSLQEEYEYLCGDAIVQESIEANEYLFTKDGKCANQLVHYANH